MQAPLELGYRWHWNYIMAGFYAVFFHEAPSPAGTVNGVLCFRLLVPEDAHPWQATTDYWYGVGELTGCPVYFARGIIIQEHSSSDQVLCQGAQNSFCDGGEQWALLRFIIERVAIMEMSELNARQFRGDPL